MTLVDPVHQGQVVGALACQKDSYLKKLDTEVVACVRAAPPSPSQNRPGKKKSRANEETSTHSDVWLIEFADSVLFPEGGGQPSDHGIIVPLVEEQEPIPILFVQRQGLRCVCYSPKPLDVGTKVRQELDFGRRWDHMQQHTGQHLLSAVLQSDHQLQTLGWGMGSNGGMNYVDLPSKPSQEQMQAAQDRCNELIRDNLSITVDTPADAKTERLPGDYDTENGPVRVISIGGLDRNTCCGTHLAQTSHTSLILLHFTQPVHSTNTRLFFSVGDRAINASAASIDAVRRMAKMTGSPNTPADVVSSVQKATDTAADLKKQEKRLLSELAKLEGAIARATLESGKNAWVHRTLGGLEYLNMVAAEAKGVARERGVLVLASGEGQSGGALLIIGLPDAVQDLSAKAQQIATSVKGGGKGEKWQGKATAWGKGELESLKELVTENS
ncbi:Threonyl/alanyl tRNA synthetase [Stachybotrys elegans]|uniref:Threonyl/alanyl tRNA synthetase n=1 Tax=Stachybotrys elegans TaxID=80388 RepID=A0A8K0WJK5_9HYPO|nr:Threonyl/alanyl tRNA synthetase [Stachybotrys elegans]